MFNILELLVITVLIATLRFVIMLSVHVYSMQSPTVLSAPITSLMEPSEVVFRARSIARPRMGSTFYRALMILASPRIV